MTEAELTALATRALTGLGLAPGEAADAARILVLGDLFGHHTHGVGRLESYGARIDNGAVKTGVPIGVESVAPTIAKVDGGSALGPVVGMRALREAMDRARALGVGIAFVRNSNHFGAIGPYCYLAAEAGFATIIGSNASTTMAPTGGREARLGNSPLGFGVPRPGGRPIILDMAMSMVARAKIRNAQKRGESIPDTWATDAEGRPTRDPQAALDGFLLPMGGYKGYGLALIVDLFAGLLSNAAYLTQVNSWSDDPESPGNLGHFFLAIDTATLGSPEWLAERMRDFAAILHSTPPADPDRPVLLPGEIEMGNLERQRRDGIAVDAALCKLLEGYAARAVNLSGSTSRGCAPGGGRPS
jgi:LDH2 family malate/lactate/ureidoglycolate dehydrogenase